MKKTLIILAAFLYIALALQAKESMETPDSTAISPIESSALMGREATPEEKEYARQLAKYREAQEQINTDLPAIDGSGQTITSTNVYVPMLNGYGLWNLHPGLNVNIGASVFANFGKGYGHGAGFSQEVSAIYATNLSPKLTLAVGGYVNHLTYKGDNYYVGGVNALLNYRFNEHWSAYVFAQKAISSNNTGNLWGYRSPYYRGYAGYGFAPMGLGYAGFGMGYGMMDTRFMDRIGGGVTYQWGQNNQNAISVSVEYDHVPNSRRDTFYDTQRYSYPSRP